MESKTQKDITLLVLRITVGTVIAAHGFQKLFGWFSGYGFEGTMGYFTETVGLPYLLGLLVILGESLGALALVIGLFGRFMALSIFVIIAGAMILDHSPNGFFMNWDNIQKGEGIEFDLLVFGLCLPVVLFGSGAYSVDAILSKRIFTVFGRPVSI